MTNSQLLEQGLKVAQNYDVTTKENSAVVYSISYQKTSKNRDDAIEFIKQNTDKMLIEHTECGAKLVELGFESTNTLNCEEVKTIWAIASRRFINAAKGNIIAFVNNAHPESVFMSVELPNILNNPNITTVNNIDKNIFAKQFQK
ncbi:MAG: hypothetical protein IJW75_04420 [Alphaproteobacteria bacterium]|nr:hypothetical protein [Alphaproteobacteria bacterium]